MKIYNINRVFKKKKNNNQKKKIIIKLINKLNLKRQCKLIKYRSLDNLRQYI